VGEANIHGSDFKRWRKSLNLSQKEAAEALGQKRRVVQYYEKGERDGKSYDIPKYIRLACFALTKGVEDYEGPEDSTGKGKRKSKSDDGKHKGKGKSKKHGKGMKLDGLAPLKMKPKDETEKKHAKPVKPDAAAGALRGKPKDETEKRRAKR